MNLVSQKSKFEIFHNAPNTSLFLGKKFAQFELITFNVLRHDLKSCKRNLYLTIELRGHHRYKEGNEGVDRFKDK